MKLTRRIVKRMPMPLRWLARRARYVARFRRRLWREGDWKTISAAEYRAAFECLGGSIHVHPDVIDLAARMSGVKPRFIAQYAADGAVRAALPILGGLLGATWESLANCQLMAQPRHRLYVGDSEVILPIARDPSGKDVPVRLPVPVGNLSCLHAGLPELVRQPSGRHARVLPYAGTDSGADNGNGPDGGQGRQLDAKFISNYRRKYRRFIKDGGTVEALQDWSATDIATTYRQLFKARFNYDAIGGDDLPLVLEQLKPFVRGSVLRMQDKPVAIQIVFAHATPRGLLAVGVNGGVDPAFQSHSPGSILYDLNIQELQREAAELGLPLRYSWGFFDDFEYKKDWCDPDSFYYHEADLRGGPLARPWLRANA